MGLPFLFFNALSVPAIILTILGFFQILVVFYPVSAIQINANLIY